MPRRFWDEPFRRPEHWLLLQALVLLAFVLLRVKIERFCDSASYEQMDMSSVRASLSQIRTLGYPLFLRLLRGLGILEASLPLVQALLHSLAVLVFYRGLCLLGMDRWAAFAAASPLLFSQIVRLQVGMVASEVLAESLVLVAIGALLPVAAGRKGLGGMLTIGVASFFAYQVRPVFLLLVPLIPCLGFAVRYLVRRDSVQLGSAWRLSVKLGAALVVPFVLFSSLRWFWVGHWGLVSFGGLNIIGIAGQFLDEDGFSSVPEDLKPLAREALSLRKDNPISHPSVENGSLNFLNASEYNYNATIWSLFLPAAEKLYGHGTTLTNLGVSDSLEINRRVSRLARFLILAHPRLYLQWVGGMLKASLLACWTNWSAAVIKVLLFLLALVQTLRLLRVGGGYWDRDRKAWSETTEYFSQKAVVWVVAVFFSVSYLLLLSSIESALARYVFAAQLFVPCLFGLLVHDCFRKFLSGS